VSACAPELATAVACRIAGFPPRKSRSWERTSAPLALVLPCTVPHSFTADQAVERLLPTLRASGVPTYLQLAHQVEHALRLGYLKPGDQLPRVRDVVASLAINPNTVLKAYRELETKGPTLGRPGQGTFIEATLGQGRRKTSL
jgi:Bacterial regulatory proteins, gntR family